MRRHTLLIVGVLALAGSLIGPAVQTAVGADTGWWGGHMFDGHMRWPAGTSRVAGPVEGAPEVAVSATEYAYSPAEVTVGPGEPVNLVLENAGDLAHDLAIPELGVRIAAGPGDREQLAVTAEWAGAFEFLCTYPGHAEAGMTGVLRVDANR